LEGSEPNDDVVVITVSFFKGGVAMGEGLYVVVVSIVRCVTVLIGDAVDAIDEVINVLGALDRCSELG